MQQEEGRMNSGQRLVDWLKRGSCLWSLSMMFSMPSDRPGSAPDQLVLLFATSEQAKDLLDSWRRTLRFATGVHLYTHTRLAGLIHSGTCSDRVHALKESMATKCSTCSSLRRKDTAASKKPLLILSLRLLARRPACMQLYR